MHGRQLGGLLGQLRKAASRVDGVSDGLLLERFLAKRDEAAFELLVWRHARMVSDLCRRVLGDFHDAEDAFQATFLTLARAGRRINKQEALASWLYKVAYRAALVVRASRARRLARERACGAIEEVVSRSEDISPLDQPEVRLILDEELNRLPMKFRAPVILCYLEGKSVDEIALQLGCPRGTVASRLVRARMKLKSRLARRGLGLAAGLAELRPTTAAHASAGLIRQVTGAALSKEEFGVVKDRVSELSQEVLRLMLMRKVKIGLAILVAVAGILAAGGGLTALVAAHSPSQETGLAGGAGGKQDEKPAKPSPAAANKPPLAIAGQAVEVSQPLAREIPDLQVFTGRLRADRSVEVRAPMSGELAKIHFTAGSTVKKGDLLFELDEKKLLDVFNRSKNDRGALGHTNQDASQFLQAARITAPADGVIGRPQVDLGSQVVGKILATITPTDSLDLVIDVDERSYLRYQRGQRASKTRLKNSPVWMHLADETDFIHEGKLVGFGDHFDPNTGTILAYATVPNPTGLFLPGMSASVRMTIGDPCPVLKVAAEAPFRVNDVIYVNVVDQQGTIQRRRVELGAADGKLWIIAGGLTRDEWVVNCGNSKLRPGDKVEPRRVPLVPKQKAEGRN